MGLSVRFSRVGTVNYYLSFWCLLVVSAIRLSECLGAAFSLTVCLGYRVNLTVFSTVVFSNATVLSYK